MVGSGSTGVGPTGCVESNGGASYARAAVAVGRITPASELSTPMIRRFKLVGLVGQWAKHAFARTRRCVPAVSPTKYRSPYIDELAVYCPPCCPALREPDRLTQTEAR
eukprot:6182843-Pleurochrysis_carterae.AAC.2